MLRRVPCYGCAFCASLRDITQPNTECTSVAGHSSQHNITQHDMLPQYPTGTAKLIWLFIVTLARTIWLPEVGLGTETCRSVFNVLMCKFHKFYICAVVGVIIEWLDNMHGVTVKIAWCHFLLVSFLFLFAQHVSDINISIIRSLRLFCWITTLVVLFLVRCVVEFRCGWVGVVSVLQAEACNTP